MTIKRDKLKENLFTIHILLFAAIIFNVVLKLDSLAYFLWNNLKNKCPFENVLVNKIDFSKQYIKVTDRICYTIVQNL